jgi:hypothetical protein
MVLKEYRINQPANNQINQPITTPMAIQYQWIKENEDLMKQTK